MPLPQCRFAPTLHRKNHRESTPQLPLVSESVNLGISTGTHFLSECSTGQSQQSGTTTTSVGWYGVTKKATPSACECRGKLLSRSHSLALTLSDNNVPHRSEVRQPSSIIPLIFHTHPIPKMKAPSSSPAAKLAVKATARIGAVSSAHQRTALFPFRVYRKGTCQTKPWATAAGKVCTGRLKHLRQSPPPLQPLPLRRLRAAAPKPPPCLPIADRRTARPSRRAAKKAAARTA